jgi:DDE superfamily endonuclease
MQFVPSFRRLLQPFESQMTAPTFSSLLTVVSGWIMCRRHTVSAALAAVGDFNKHFSAYHRLFAAARWSLDAVGMALAGLIIGLATTLGASSIASIALVVDDTLCKKRGRHMFGAGMHYDACATGRRLSNANHSLKAHGHCWVILGIAMEFSFRPGHVYCLPVLLRLFLNRKTAARHHRAYRTKVELAREMLDRICSGFANHRFHLLADSAYGGKNLLGSLPDNCQFTCRWILNAALYKPVTLVPKGLVPKGLVPKGQRIPGHKGRHLIHGPRLPSVQQMLDGHGRRIELNVYGKRQSFRVAECVACFYATPHKPLKIVAVQPLDEHGRPKPKQTAVFYSTDTNATAERVLCLYAMRWSVEVAVHDAKQQLGLAQPQAWSVNAVQRVTPTLMLTYSLLVLWFAAEGHRRWRPTLMPWYRNKRHASFADMLAQLRQSMLRLRFTDDFKDHPRTPDHAHALQTLMRLVKQAA